MATFSLTLIIFKAFNLHCVSKSKLILCNVAASILNILTHHFQCPCKILFNHVIPCCMKPYKVIFLYNYYNTWRNLWSCIILVYNDQTLAYRMIHDPRHYRCHCYHHLYCHYRRRCHHN